MKIVGKPRSVHILVERFLDKSVQIHHHFFFFTTLLAGQTKKQKFVKNGLGSYYLVREIEIFAIAFAFAFIVTVVVIVYPIPFVWSNLQRISDVLDDFLDC